MSPNNEDLITNMKKDIRFRSFCLSAAAVFFACAILLLAGYLVRPSPHRKVVRAQSAPNKTAVVQEEKPALPVFQKPKYVRGIHMTAWVTGSPKVRGTIDALFEQTELNTAVIDIKEYEGEVYLPGIALCEANGTYKEAMPDLTRYLEWLHSRGIYTIARIVVFRDNKIARRHPEWAVKNTAGGVWEDRRGKTWLNPYSKAAWNYNLTIAEHAADMGFNEIQFDYIRFPSDGNTSACRYGQVHSTTTAPAALTAFLKEAHRRLKPKGVDISIDVFGLTTTSPHDMGIGQRIVEMSEWVDYVCPMVYPSHYNPGEYGIPDPNKAPYRTVFLGIQGAVKRLGGTVKLRPWLQDFSMGHRYGAEEVRKQIQATYDNDIGEWLLWNPRCVYTRGALKDKKFTDVLDKSAVIPAEPLYPERDRRPAEKNETGMHNTVLISTQSAK